MFHKKPRLTDLYVIKPLNQNFGDLEGFILAVKSLVNNQLKHGKKGVKLPSGQKYSYQKTLDVLFQLYSYFGLKGCFTGGCCGDCKYFLNSKTVDGTWGYCGSSYKSMLEGCTKFEPYREEER